MNRPGVNRRFLRVKLDLANRCQLRCIMCHFAHPEFSPNPAEMSRELLERVAGELFPLAHEVVPSSSAEPLLARELPRCLELCREYEVPHFHFSTNGLSLNDRMIAKILETGMTEITFSIDAATKETFEAIRTPASWEKTLAKLRLMVRRREEHGSRLPRIYVTAVLMRRNIEEMPALIRLMKDLGVDGMNFVYMGVIGGLGVEEENLLRYPELTNRILAEMERTAAEVGMDVTLPAPLPEHVAEGVNPADVPLAEEGGGVALLPAGHTLSDAEVAEFINRKNREFNLAVKPKRRHRRPCYFPWYYIHVNPDGTVFPCGCWFEFSTFGDFRTQSFREIWTGPAYRELRRQLTHMQLRPVCANCSVANMGRPDVLASFAHRAKLRRQRVAET